MTKKEFYDLHYRLRVRDYPNPYITEVPESILRAETVSYNNKCFACFGPREKYEYRVTVKREDIDSRGELCVYKHTFKGFLRNINERDGSLEIYNIENDKTYAYKYYDIELKKLNPTYRDLMEKLK